jgi:hypothetical protein
VGYCLLALSVLAVMVVVILVIVFPLIFVNALSSMRMR